MLKKNDKAFLRGVFGVLILTSICINVFIHLKIWFHKAKPIFNQSNVIHLVKTFLLGEVDKQSMFTYAFNVCGILISLTGIWATAQIEKMRFQDMSQYPRYLLFYYSNLVCPALFISAVVVSFYQKKSLTNAISHGY
jgi:hypothetical protein